VLMTPGLSVIIGAIKEARRIVQRMNSYAIYRISETLRVLVFVTAAILVFNFFPVTAIMIVMLALLNDGAILTIAYDNVHYKNQPEKWNMRLVLGMASILGLVGPVAAFGLFLLADKVFNLNHDHLQTLMYLMLSVAGSMTIFLTRTRGPFWSIRPKRILLLAVAGAETVATLLAGFGILMTALGWRWVAFVWGYAIIWFLVTDRVKLLGYRILDPPKLATATNHDSRVTESAMSDHDNGADTPRTVHLYGPGAEASVPDADQSSTVAPFHTDTDPDGVYHDNDDCPYGSEIKRHGNDQAGADRRLCDWCAQHPVPV
jgi:H+-transporting ATPase